MTWLGMEHVVDACVAALQAGMGDAVDAVNAAVTDSIEIVEPNEASYLIGISMDEIEKGTIQLANPTVIVNGEDSLPTGGRAQPDTGGEYEAQHTLAVSVLFTSMTPEERVRMTWRYQASVIAVLAGDDDLSARWRGCGYMEHTIPQGVWRDAVTMFELETFETP
jgi:hypothetical protein